MFFSVFLHTLEEVRIFNAENVFNLQMAHFRCISKCLLLVYIGCCNCLHCSVLSKRYFLLLSTSETDVKFNNSGILPTHLKLIVKNDTITGGTFVTPDVLINVLI